MVKVSKLEIAWTLAVVAILAGVTIYSTFLLYNLDALAPNPGEYVTVIGHQWYWEFCYSNDTCFNSTYDATTNTVSGGALWAVPGSVVQINITGADVVHSLYIAGIGVQINAVPDRVNMIQFTAPQGAPGTQYLIQCTEFCGTFHGTMRSFLVLT